MRTTAAVPFSRDAIREAGEQFEKVFLDAFQRVDWKDGKRLTQGAGQDLRRRPELHSLQRIGAVLALLGRTRPEALTELLLEIETWAMSVSTEPVCVLAAAQDEAQEDADADKALLALLGSPKSAANIERAINQLAEQVASAKRLLVGLKQESAALPTARRVFVTGRIPARTAAR